jgi:dipeptidyl aminopeptidase/acylaminoacyl peptidase
MDAWAPDGKRLVFAMVQDEASTAPKPIVIDALHFKQDEDGYLRVGSARHLYLCDVGEKRVDPLTADPLFNEDLPTWSPDGRLIAFIRTHERGPDSDGREDIDVVEPVAGAAPRRIVRPFAPNSQRLEWSPDGKLVAYLQGLEPKFNAYIQDRLAVVAASGGPARPLTDGLDRAVMSYAFAMDSASIVIAAQAHRAQ